MWNVYDLRILLDLWGRGETLQEVEIQLNEHPERMDPKSETSIKRTSRENERKIKIQTLLCRRYFSASVRNTLPMRILHAHIRFSACPHGADFCVCRDGSMRAFFFFFFFGKT